PPARAPGARSRAGSVEVPHLALGRTGMASDRAQEAQADGQGSHGGHHPTRIGARHRLTTRVLPPGGPRATMERSFRGLSHLSPAGEARMVDVSAKAETAREAIAHATLR